MTHADITPKPRRGPIVRALLPVLIISAVVALMIASGIARSRDRLHANRGALDQASVILRGYAFLQNVRRGHYELGVEAHPRRRVAAAITQLARAI